MWARNLTLTSVAVAAMALAGGLGNTQAGPEPGQTASTAAQEAEVKTVRGQVVDIHAYLAAEHAGEPEQDSGLLRVLAPDMPIALVAEDEGLIDALRPGKRIHLIIFDPQVDESKSSYASARKLVGQRVAITGKALDRHGLHAIIAMGTVELLEDEQQRADAVGSN